MLTAEILSQGDEVVTGQTIDTNANFLASELTALGFDVVRHSAVGDRIDDLVQLFAHAGERSDLVICTGGLGPTNDDLTALAASRAFERPLFRDEVALEQIRALYARYGRTMPEINAKQADRPEGSELVRNHWGTAPGFAVDAKRALCVFMPGVPREMKQMFRKMVLPLLHDRFAVSPSRLVTFRTVGTGESNLQEALGDYSSPDVVIGTRTMLPENHIKLRFAPATSEERIAEVAHAVFERVGRWAFTVEGLTGVLPLDDVGGPHVHAVSRALVAANATLAVAESCTGGRVAAACTSVPGSSTWFLEGAVTYSNAAKMRQLGVQAESLEAHGAVSAPVAEEMAAGIRAASGATYGLSTTGIAGPGGGTDEKPVGTVFIALSTAESTTSRRIQLGGDRQRIQELATASVIEMLRRRL